MIELPCWSCLHLIQVADDREGRTAPCPRCQAKIDVPPVVWFNCPTCKTNIGLRDAREAPETTCGGCGRNIWVPGRYYWPHLADSGGLNKAQEVPKPSGAGYGPPAASPQNSPTESRSGTPEVSGQPPTTDPSERSFEEEVVAAGFLTAKQIAEVRSMRDMLASSGQPVALAGLCMRLRLLTPEQTAIVMRKVEGVDGESHGPKSEGSPTAPGSPPSSEVRHAKEPSAPPMPPMPARAAAEGRMRVTKKVELQCSGCRGLLFIVLGESPAPIRCPHCGAAGTAPSRQQWENMKATHGPARQSKLTPSGDAASASAVKSSESPGQSSDHMDDEQPQEVQPLQQEDKASHPSNKLDDQQLLRESLGAPKGGQLQSQKRRRNVASGEDPSQYKNLPAALYDEQYATASFVRFQCFHCSGILKLPWSDVGLIVQCDRCKGEMRLVSRAQAAREERRARELKEEEAKGRKEAAKRLEELRRSGVVPPDNIAILGRPSSGKSVYLAILYHQLWMSNDDLSGRALDGRNHSAIMKDYQSLREGRWLAGTAAVRKCDLQIRFRGTPVTLSTMDYPGEVFQQVFYENRIETPEQQALYNQIEMCMGAMLLVDPDHAVRGEADMLDVEFSFVQVAEHLLQRGFGEHMLLMLTKRDRNHRLVESAGGPRDFVAQYMPRLLSTHPRLNIMHISSVPTVDGPDGRPYPSVDVTQLDHVREPLRRLLTQIDPAYLQYLAELDQETGQRAAEQSSDAAAVDPRKDQGSPLQPGSP